MLFDRPARYLYEHHRNLYAPMRVLATHYRHIVFLGVAIFTVWLVGELLSDGHLLTSLGILNP